MNFQPVRQRKRMHHCVFLEEGTGKIIGVSDECMGKMLRNPEFYEILEELVEFGISRYQVNYSSTIIRIRIWYYIRNIRMRMPAGLLNWERNEVPLNIGGYKYDKKTKTFPDIYQL